MKLSQMQREIRSLTKEEDPEIAFITEDKIHPIYLVSIWTEGVYKNGICLVKPGTICLE